MDNFLTVSEITSAVSNESISSQFVQKTFRTIASCLITVSRTFLFRGAVYPQKKVNTSGWWSPANSLKPSNIFHFGLTTSVFSQRSALSKCATGARDCYLSSL